MPRGDLPGRAKVIPKRTRNRPLQLGANCKVSAAPVSRQPQPFESVADSEPGPGHRGHRAFRRGCGRLPDGDPGTGGAPGVETESAVLRGGGRTGSESAAPSVAARPVLVVGRTPDANILCR